VREGCAELKQVEKEKFDWRDRVKLPPCDHLLPWSGPPLALPAEAAAFPEWASSELLDLLWQGKVKCPEDCPLSSAQPTGEPAAGGSGSGGPRHACVKSDSKDQRVRLLLLWRAHQKQIALAKLEPAAALEPKLVRSPPVRNKERQA